MSEFYCKKCADIIDDGEQLLKAKIGFAKCVLCKKEVNTTTEKYAIYKNGAIKRYRERRRIKTFPSEPGLYWAILYPEPQYVKQPRYDAIVVVNGEFPFFKIDIIKLFPPLIDNDSDVGKINLFGPKVEFPTPPEII